MKRILIGIVLIMLVFLMGCTTQKIGDLSSQDSTPELTGVESVDQLSEELSGIEDIEKELDFAELDSIEDDLANLDW